MSALQPLSAHLQLMHTLLYYPKNTWKLYFSFLCTGLISKQMGSCIFILKQGETAVSCKVTQLTDHNKYSSEYGTSDP